MSFDRGPLITWEIIWQSGHVERVRGHQFSTSGGDSLFSSGPPQPRRFYIHGEFGGHWRLILSGLEDDIRTVREITADEPVPEDDPWP